MARSLLVFTAFLLLTPAAMAQPGRQRGSRTIPDPFAKAIDKNGDGILSATEIAAAADSLKALDVDGDNKIAPTEIRNAIRAALMRGGPGRGPAGGRGGGASALERAGLKLGEAAPDVTLHNDEGGPFRLADLKGKHAVIVFGCLT